MSRRVVQTLSLIAAAAGCAGPERAAVPAARETLAVVSPGAPFTLADGAAAKREADAQCGPAGVRTSIYDRFDAATGAWVFVEGCG